MSARKPRAPWSDKASTSKQRPRSVPAKDPSSFTPLPLAPSPRAERRPPGDYPIGQRDSLLIGALVVVVVTTILVKLIAYSDESHASSAELAPIVAAAKRAFPGEGDEAALKKLSARLDEQYPPTAAAPAAGPRGITAAQRAAMVGTLKGETGAVKKAWFSVQSTNAEAVTFQKWLADAFTEAGWQVESSPWQGGGLKPGVFFFAAEEKNDSYVETAQKALEAGGVKVTAAIGYRAFYKDKKKENPSWSGVDMKPDQGFAIVVGSKEDPAAAAP